MNILLIGPPGVGKGTQASYLTNKYDLSYVTTGDLLRRESKSESEIGLQIKDIISSGGLVSDDIVKKLMENAVAASDKGILFDGYPRTIDQAKTLNQILISNNRSLDFVINMALDDDVLIKRISGRYVCADCSSVYNKFFVKPKVEGVCDKCGSTNFITRSDDSEAVIKKRLDIFHRENNSILEYYREKRLLVDISCDASVEEISQKISLVIDKSNVSI